METPVMVIKEISENECRQVLERAALGRLGCSFENQPYVVPIFFAYEANELYVFSTYGQKIAWMRANPKVCLQVDEMTGPTHWVSVIANGRFQELVEPQFAVERAHARELLETRQRWWLNSLAERRIKVPDMEVAPLFFAIRIDSLTGIRGTAE